MIAGDDGQRISNLGYIKLLKELESLIRKRTEVNGSTRDKKYYCPSYFAHTLTIQDICLVRSHKYFKGFVFIDNEHFRNWSEIMHNLHVKKKGEGFRTFP
jgi:hypothetical protein